MKQLLIILVVFLLSQEILSQEEFIYVRGQKVKLAASQEKVSIKFKVKMINTGYSMIMF